MQADSIVDLGFLSPHVASYIQEHRKRHAPMFEIADELNRIGQRTMSDASVTVTEKGTSDPKLIAFLLLIRTLSNFQGAIILAERGMVVEALTLARCCYENAYMLAALQKEGDAFVKDMLAAEMHARKGQSRWMLDDPGRMEYVPGGVEQMKKNIETINAGGKTAKLDFKDAAERGGIADFYIWYKNLSWEAAHPTIQALSRYLGDGKDKGSIVWGPEVGPEAVGSAVSYCLSAVFGALIICAEELNASRSREEASALWQRYKAMVLPNEEGEKPG
jgi:hypothetical protein